LSLVRARRTEFHRGTPGRSEASSVRSAFAAAAIAAALAAAVLFAAFNHDFSVNGLRYAGDVERGTDLFHPNHLLPNALYWIAYRFAQACGAAGLRAIWLMQAINVVAGSIAAAAVASIAARRGDRFRAVAIGALYAFGFAAWNFAEEPDVYVLPAAAVALSIALLDARAAVSWRMTAALGVLGVFAVLTLQQYVLWYPVLLALVVRRDLGAARAAKLFALAIGIPLACLCAYLATGFALGKFASADQALGWFLGYAWQAHGFGTYRAAPDFGARVASAILALGNLAVAYEVILSRAAIAAAAAVAAALLWLGACAALALRRVAPAQRGDAVIVTAWCAANFVFATWWESRNIEFLFPVWVGAVILLAFAAPALDRRLLAITAVLLVAVNGACAFWPQRTFPLRYRVAHDLATHEHLGSGDVLVTEELNTVGYLHYFDRADVRFQPGAVSAAMHAAMPVAQVRAAIGAALESGARVYTTELDEHGRLRAIAQRFALLGRRGFDGSVDDDIAALYRGFDVRSQPVAGARRVQAPAP